MNSRERYDKVAMALHWLVAALALAQIALGWWMLDLPKSPPGLRADWFNLHKSIGLTIGLLMLARLGWRLTHAAPPLPRSMPHWQGRPAPAGHFLPYAAPGAARLPGPSRRQGERRADGVRGEREVRHAERHRHRARRGGGGDPRRLAAARHGPRP